MTWQPKTALPDDGWKPKTAQSDNASTVPKSFIDASLPMTPSTFTGDASMLKKFGEDEPDYKYGDILPIKKNIKTGEVSGALPEFIRSPIRGFGDLIQQAQNKGIQPTPDAVSAMMTISGLPGQMPKTPKISNFPKSTFGKNLMEDLKPESIIPHEKIKEISQQNYGKAAQSGGALKPEVTNKWLTNLSGLIPKGQIAKELSQDRPFMQLIDRLQIAKDKPITLQDAQEIDELLGAAADSHFKPGGMTKEGQKILEIQDKFRDAIFDAKESDMTGGMQGFKAWDDAKFYWSQSMKQRDIETMIERANLTDNPATSLKTQMKNLYTNKKRMRPFNTPEEQAAIKKAATTGVIDELLRLPASRLISIGRLASGGGMSEAAAAKAASMAAGGVRNAYQVNKVNNVSRQISKQVQKRMAGEQKPAPMKFLPAPETFRPVTKTGEVLPASTAGQMRSNRYQSEFDKALRAINQKKQAQLNQMAIGSSPDVQAMIKDAQKRLAESGQEPGGLGEVLMQIYGGK